MKDYLYSGMTFYPYREKELYERAGKWPESGVDIDEETREKFFVYPDGKVLGEDKDGLPVWVDAPPPTHDELVIIAENKKNELIDSANEFINRNQWPGKAALGRLKDEQLGQYNIWLDYLDALMSLDTSTVPDVNWPQEPSL